MGITPGESVIPQFVTRTWCGGVELLTLAYRSVSTDVNSKNELNGSECIQEACNPFVLPRYRVSSVVVRMSEGI